MINWIMNFFRFLNGTLQKELSQAKQKALELSKYQGIVDALAEAERILKEAENKAFEIIKKADLEAETQKRVSHEMRKEAEDYAKTTKDGAKLVYSEATKKAEQTIANAQSEQNRIIEAAHKQAEQIAGDAYKAMQNASNLEKTAKAMKNIVEGYGNAYLIPTYNLLDELADELQHTEAGEKLKQVREQIRLMVKNRTASKCDYVEANRKETAMDFVTDAFNGKVDSILSLVKKDNFGILEQKIKDAFQVVNFNGQAFRNAVIVPTYLELRIQELKWAVVLNELKFQEKEEQRLIKERIKEEEKAKREYEKAIKDSEKERETIQKAIDKAQIDLLAKTNESQRAEYQAKLEVLLGKLKDAEAKNQRALSMAQQTKAGHVYIISNVGSFGDDVLKIGMTRRLEPMDRVKELGDASVPFEFDVHAMIYSLDAPKLEAELHKKFVQTQVNKVNPRKEFFKIPVTLLKQEIERLGIETKWTMAAEAREYRESLSIEQSIQHDENKKAEWLKYQSEVVIQGEEEVEAIEN